MRLQELLAEIESRDLDYPLSREDAIDAVGDVELESSDDAQETVENALSREPRETFNEPQEIYEAVAANVDESFVGRKEYDDRGPNPDYVDDEAF